MFSHIDPDGQQGARVVSVDMLARLREHTGKSLQKSLGGIIVYCIRSAAATALLFLLPWVGFAQASPAEPQESYDPIVLVWTETLGVPRLGQGFVVGDGTLVVTAHHVVHETSGKDKGVDLFVRSPEGSHWMAGVVTVLSPYLGASCDAEIVASDPELDLAVLRTPWKGHPAFGLADDDSVRLAERVTVAGMTYVLLALSSRAEESLIEWKGIESQTLPVDFVAVRQDTPRFIQTAAVGSLGPGASGTPMLLPERPAAVGCFTSVVGRKEGETGEVIAAKGPASAQVRELLAKAGQAESLNAAEQQLPQPPDAMEAWSLWLEILSAWGRKQPQEALEKAQALIELRPGCGFAYRIGADAAARSKKDDLAETLWQDALSVDTEGAATRLFYASHLSKRDEHDRALEELDALWQAGKHRSTVTTLMVNILSDRGEYARCADLLTEALKDEPDNAWLWYQLGGMYAEQMDYVPAASCFARAVELMPENERFQKALDKVKKKADNPEAKD